MLNIELPFNYYFALLQVLDIKIRQNLLKRIVSAKTKSAKCVVNDFLGELSAT